MDSVEDPVRTPDLGVIDPDEIAAIVCRHCPDWSREEIRKRVLAALASTSTCAIKPEEGTC